MLSDVDDVFENTPFVGLVHNISKNQLKYLNSKIKDYDLGHEIRFIMMIYDNQGISQDQIVNVTGQSKANIAKSLKKLEDRKLIKREVNPQNRRKYMLFTTPKSDELIPKIRKITKDWEREVGITDDDNVLKQRLREIAINGMKIIEEG